MVLQMACLVGCFSAVPPLKSSGRCGTSRCGSWYKQWALTAFYHLPFPSSPQVVVPMRGSPQLLKCKLSQEALQVGRSTDGWHQTSACLVGSAFASVLVWERAAGCGRAVDIMIV